MEYLLPVLKADFQVCETFEFRKEDPLECPLTAFGASRDVASKVELEEWRRHTTGRFTLHLVEGDHFFIIPHRALITRIIAGQLFETLNTRAATTGEIYAV